MIAFKRHKPPTGARPGMFAVQVGSPKPRISQFIYDGEFLQETRIDSVAELRKDCPGELVRWIDVQGLGDADVLLELAEIFKIHQLAIADVVNVPQRPKNEAYDHHQLIIVRMARINNTGPSGSRRFTMPPTPSVLSAAQQPVNHPEQHFDVEQVAIIVGANFVITFQERYGDVFDPVRQRLRMASGKIRCQGADYLAYALVDTVIDGYFPVMELLSETLEDLEDEVLTTPSSRHPEEIHRIKSLLLSLRRSLWPMRDMLNSILREPTTYIKDDTRVYFRDVLDHAIQLSEVLETQRETVIGLMNTYLSVMSNRTNEVMKVLTVITTIFIPLSFITGIYGMNFEFMPELGSKLGYPLVWLVMVSVGVALGYYFKKQGWFHSDR
ncbi:MAG TPA: magnesium/cobalt transporter CorA [Polyangiaceae bacterium]|nr:magnesium/cobalt transporter CorA [Polyangiaceae bacterium]